MEKHCEERVVNSYLLKLVEDLPSWAGALYVKRYFRVGLDEQNKILILFDKESSSRLENEIEHFVGRWVKKNPFWAFKMDTSIIQ